MRNRILLFFFLVTCLFIVSCAQHTTCSSENIIFKTFEPEEGIWIGERFISLNPIREHIGKLGTIDATTVLYDSITGKVWFVAIDKKQQVLFCCDNISDKMPDGEYITYVKGYEDLPDWICNGTLFVPLYSKNEYGYYIVKYSAENSNSHEKKEIYIPQKIIKPYNGKNPHYMKYFAKDKILFEEVSTFDIFIFDLCTNTVTPLYLPEKKDKRLYSLSLEGSRVVYVGKNAKLYIYDFLTETVIDTGITEKKIIDCFLYGGDIYYAKDISLSIPIMTIESAPAKSWYKYNLVTGKTKSLATADKGTRLEFINVKS